MFAACDARSVGECMKLVGGIVGEVACCVRDVVHTAKSAHILVRE